MNSLESCYSWPELHRLNSNVKKRPHAKQAGIHLDAGPEKMLALLDKFLAEEAEAGQC